MYEVTKEIPYTGGHTMKGSKYPFEQMAVGDSFPIEKEYRVSAATCGDKWSAARRLGRKFKAGRDGKGGWRIWRVA